MKTLSTSGVTLAAPGTCRETEVKRGWMLAALYVVLAAVAVYPVFTVAVPPLVDYPNHLARMHILANAADVPELRGNYVADWKLHPNMAMELIVPQLARFMSIYMAGKVFIAATLLLLLGGTMTLRKTLYGKVGLWPVVTFLLLYSHILFWGFLGYLFTAGLGLFAFSAWIGLRERGPLLRIAAFSTITIILYVSHLFGLLVYGLLVLGYELWRVRDFKIFSRDMVGAWSVSGAQFVLPFALFAQWTIANSSPVPALTEYGPLRLRFIALISPVHMGIPAIDIPTAIFLALVFALCRSNKSIGFAGEMKLPILLLTAAALALPQYLSSVWGTHFRIPTIIACVLVAGVRIEPEAWRLARIVACAAIGMFCLRTAVVTLEWAEIDRKFEEFRKASAVMEPGKRMLVVEDSEDLLPGKLALYGMQFWHLPALAVIERSAFLPYLFTGHVGIHAASGVQLLDTPTGIPLSRMLLQDGIDPASSMFPLGYPINRYVRAYWTGWPKQYDYVVSIRFANEANPAPAYLQPVRRGSFFDIYRVVKPAQDAVR